MHACQPTFIILNFRNTVRTSVYHIEIQELCSYSMTNLIVTNRQDTLLAVHNLHFKDWIRKLQ